MRSANVHFTLVNYFFQCVMHSVSVRVSVSVSDVSGGICRDSNLALLRYRLPGLYPHLPM